ncbi:MAG TPA: CheR family methyltransferase [Acidimicrobiia bacterium]|nr:CheR family methyltransferase [Acidimicrobiia bacterium]
MAVPDVEARPEALVAVAAELLGADVGTARAADLDRAARAAAVAAGEPLDAPALAERIRSAPPDDPVQAAFVRALTIRETHFFRVRGQFEALAERVLPALIADRAPGRRLRLWSAGCSTGEEAWSLAILLEQLAPVGWHATVLATDVDERALDHARRGVYGARSFRGETPDRVRARWFRPADGGWEVDPRLRRRVHFARLNLVSDPYPSYGTRTSAIDLVLCRNVLIYFTAEARARTAARLAACVAPGGWLAVAPAELGAVPFPGLTVRHFPAAILHQRPDPRSATVAPAPAPPPRAAPRRPHPAAPEPARATEPAGPAAPAARRLAQARRCADRGQRAEAERLLRSALEADPLLAAARELRAQLLLEQGDDEGAEDELRGALFLDPGLAVAQATLGALLARRGEHSRARAAAAEVRRLLAGRAPDETVPGAATVTVGGLLADLDTWDRP